MRTPGGFPDLSVWDELDNSIWGKRGVVDGRTSASKGSCALATGTLPPWSPRLTMRNTGHEVTRPVSKSKNSQEKVNKHGNRKRENQELSLDCSNIGFRIQGDGRLVQHMCDLGK